MEARNPYFSFSNRGVHYLLQDGSVLLGLRIDGPSVTGFSAIKDGWRIYIGDVFGARPSDESGGLVGGRLQFTWLNSSFGSLRDDASDVQLKRYTQSYVLQLIGGILFTDHSGNRVRCMYIPLIHDLDSCGKLSWGSAVLHTYTWNYARHVRKIKWRLLDAFYYYSYGLVVDYILWLLFLVLQL